MSVLGPLRATLAGRPVDIGPMRQQAVLAALALSPSRSVSRGRLLEDVWGREMPDGNVVPVYVYRLRKILRLGDRPDSVIRRDRYGYGLVQGVAEVDARCVDDLVARAGAAERAGDLPGAVRLCERALELFRGEPLAGLPGPVAALLMHALRQDGRRAEALAVFDRIARRLADDLGVDPGDLLLRARRTALPSTVISAA
ncbi:AfsR/SARP family transcriptional regulator [Streptomyces misionensis]|uniref:AfsR/SARP family transcriptional regulator n=1 Tax=Streptomyces misionensis TaxID=67331 RepID=UPI0036A0385B